MIALDLVKRVEILRVPDVYKLGHGQANHEHLAELFFQRELFECLPGPLFTVMIKMDRRRALKVAGKGRERQGQQTDAGKHQLLHHGATIPEILKPFGQNIANDRPASAWLAGIDLAGAPPSAKRFPRITPARSSASLAWRRESG